MMVPRISSTIGSALQHDTVPQYSVFAFDHGRARWQQASRAGALQLSTRRGYQLAKAVDSQEKNEENSSIYAAASTAEWTNIMQQQLPPGHSLQPLLQPLLPNSSPGSDGLPGDDVGPIAAASTSLTVGMPPPPVQPVMEAVNSVAAKAPVAAGMPAPIDIVAREVLEEPQHVTAASAAKFLGSHWVKQVAVISFAAMLCYLDRTNISTAIVPMAEQFGWDKQFCGAVLSAFFAGYGATQVYGGVLSDKYGGSAVLALGLGVWSLATALTPMAAAAGAVPLLAARAVLGMAQGVAFPAMHALLAKHVPSKVRSGAIGIIMACAHIGTATGFGASPAIIDALGWQWTYYLFGGAALLWLPLWIHVAREAARNVTKAVAAATAATAAAAKASRAVPAAGMIGAPVGAGAGAVLCSATVQDVATIRLAAREADFASTSRSAHPLLDAIEQQHLQQQKQVVPAAPATTAAAHSSHTESSHSESREQQKINIGFWPLMRRKEVWAIAVAQYAAGWGFYGLLAWLPQFLIESCGLQLSQLGAFTLAPYLMQAAVGAGAGLMADNLIVKRNWGVKDVRILMQVAGMLGPAACLFAAASPFGASSPYVATGLITAGMGMSALTCSGVSANHLDIAPRHAGVVFGVGNTAGTLAGLVAVPGLGYVLQHTGNWSLAFGLAAAHNVVGAALWAKWVGDEPLPEDGGDAEPVQQAKQLQLPEPAVMQAGPGLKLKAA